MFQKLLLIILIIFLVYTIVKMYNKPQNIDHSKKKPNEPSDMVECKNCGTYCQEDDAIVQDGKYYCSSECAKSAR